MSKKNETLTFPLSIVNGVCDRAASLKAAEAALDARIAGEGTQNESVAAAVHAVFDQYKGDYIVMPTLAALVLPHLGAVKSNVPALQKRALEYVRANSGKREEGKPFGIKKGDGGGVCRWADVPQKSDESATTAPAMAETIETDSDETDSTEA